MNAFSMDDFRAGGHDAFTYIYKDVYTRLLKWAGYWLWHESREDAEDVVSHVIERVYILRNTFENYRHIKAFLFASVRLRSTALRRMKKEHIRKQRIIGAIIEVEEEHVLRDILQKERLNRLRNVIRNMPYELAVVMQYTYIHDFTAQEISTLTGMTNKSVINIRSRGGVVLAILGHLLKDREIYRQIKLLILEGNTNTEIVSYLSNIYEDHSGRNLYWLVSMLRNILPQQYKDVIVDMGPSNGKFSASVQPVPFDSEEGRERFKKFMDIMAPAMKNICMLLYGAKTVQEVAEITGTSQSNVKQTRKAATALLQKLVVIKDQWQNPFYTADNIREELGRIRLTKIMKMVDSGVHRDTIAAELNITRSVVDKTVEQFRKDSKRLDS